MIRILFKIVGFLTLLLLYGSQQRFSEMAAVPFARVRIAMAPIANPGIVTKSPLIFMNGWILSSANQHFGGISGLLHDQSGFTAVTDASAIIRFQITAKHRVVNASTAPLPQGCLKGRLKPSLDSESITRDQNDGSVIIGFEWRNAICRVDRDMRKAIRLTRPPAMKAWPITGGAEAIVSLRDGRILVFAERSWSSAGISPALIFSTDPTDPDTQPRAFRYRPPAGYRPTDVAELPDGRLLIVNRRYQFPVFFSAIITIVENDAIKPGALVSGKKIGWIERPGVADNFEAIAVYEQGGRTYMGLMSDDNFMPFQATHLLMFEVVGAVKRPADF